MDSAKIMLTKHSQYNPRGLAKTKHIALRLMPDELADANRIAAQLKVSKSNLARSAYLAGLPIVQSASNSKDD